MKTKVKVIIYAVFIAVYGIVSLSGCEKKTDSNGNTSTSSVSSETSDFDSIESWDDSEATKIILSGDSASVDGSGVKLDGGSVYIIKAGSYIISGALTDGQIIVEADKTEKVQLVLNGVTAYCSDSAPLYIKSADKTVITLADGTTNTFTDSSSYTLANGEDEPNACIFSKDDLTINGSGKLIVQSNYNNGIGSKNDLKIINGNISITSVNHGLKGKDSVVISSGEITVNAGNDGIKSSNDTESDLGSISITGGNIVITAGDDALQAFTGISITGGLVTTYAEGKSTNCDGTVNITEGCLTEK